MQGFLDKFVYVLVSVFSTNRVFCPMFCVGSPVLGYLAAGILIGPYGLSIIRHVHGTKAIAEFGVVFLLFNIGLEVILLTELILFLFLYSFTCVVLLED